MSRRVTGAEEEELREQLARSLDAERSAELERSRLDRLVMEIADAGGRAADIAAILEVSRTTVYSAIDRARQAD